MRIIAGMQMRQESADIRAQEEENNENVHDEALNGALQADEKLYYYGEI